MVKRWTLTNNLYEEHTIIRQANVSEFDVIYALGFDVWGEGLSFPDYLSLCRSSQKYQRGTWYVLTQDEQIVAAAIIYGCGHFGLGVGCYGLGSLATSHLHRRQGYGAALTKAIGKMLLERPETKAIYLHSDIDRQFYQKLGYRRIGDSQCLYLAKEQQSMPDTIPDYF